MSGDFDGAVQWARTVLQPYVKSSGIELGDNEPSEILFRFHLKILWVQDDSGGQFLYHPEALSALRKYADTSRGAFDLLSQICAMHVDRGEPVPENVRSFAALKLMGAIDPPAKTRASKTFMRNVYLYGLAQVCARDFGLTLTRGEASAPHSACDAVVQALAELGHHISWRAVKELFVNQSAANLRSTADQIRAAVAEIEEFVPDIVKPWNQSIHRSSAENDVDGDDRVNRTENGRPRPS